MDYTRKGFEMLSAFKLLLSALIILSAIQYWYKKLVIALITIFIVGMCVEIIGVYTGRLFGAYHYTSTLGFAIFNVPIIIGINWIVLTLSTASWIHPLRIQSFYKVILGATMMVVLDILLEFFAVKHHLWVWHESNYPGLQNFIGWFITGIITHSILRWSKYDESNVFAKVYLILLILFLLGDLCLI
jgi:putative membrane protein